MPAPYAFPDEDGDITDVDPIKSTTPDKDELEIDIVDDTPAGDRGRPALQEPVDDPTEEELGQYSSAVRARLNKLTHRNHDTRREKERLQRERDELERFAGSVVQERDRYRKLVGEGTELVTSQAKTLADTEVEAAKAELRAAHEAFDNDAIVDSQIKLNAAQIKRDRIENSRAPTSQSEKEVVHSPPQNREAAPQLDGRTQKWMSNNKWFGDGGDEAMTGYALGLHQRLVKQHGDAYTRTDEYFSQIDKAVRQTFPDQFKTAGSKPTTSIVAPAGRSTATRRVQITSTQAALAKRLGLTPQQYAAEVLKVEASND